MATIHIKGLFLRAYLGFSEHELDKLQDVVIDIRMEYDSVHAEESDDPNDALDYKLITKKIVTLVEHGHFNLIEALARKVLNVVMADDRVLQATVEIAKPHALRFADSVQVGLTAFRNGK
ncbi:MAG: FolB domain-containing protein [Breznakibacter sp.]